MMAVMTHIALALSCLLSAVLTTICWWLRRRHRALEQRCAAALHEGAAVSRALQLFAHEMHGVALGLRGHVDRLAHDSHSAAPSLAVVTAQLDHLADELAQHVMPQGRSYQLACESVALAPLVTEAMTALQAAIAPGRRHLRIVEAHPPDLVVLADRRALRLMLARVLGEAVRSSAQDDGIDISWQASARGVVLHIADEGAGTVLPGLAGLAQDSRGIGLRLSLARALAHAHGGALEVEAHAGVGTRVAIRLPAERLRDAWPLPLGAGNDTAHMPVSQSDVGVAACGG